MSASVKRAGHNHTVRFIPVKDGDVIDLGDSGMPGISGRHHLMGFKPGPGPRAAGWIIVLVDESAPAGTRPVKHRPLKAVPAPRRVPPAPVDERTRLVKEIRSLVPFIEGEHPDLAAMIRDGMDAVEAAS